MRVDLHAIRRDKVSNADHAVPSRSKVCAFVHLGVVMLLVVDKAGFSDAGLALEDLMIPVRSCC